MNQMGVESFTPMQLRMLDALLSRCISFQVTSACGSGKTLLLLFAFVACLSNDPNATLIYCYDSSRNHIELRDQVIDVVRSLSNELVSCCDAGNIQYPRDVDRIDHLNSEIDRSLASGVQVILTPLCDLPTLSAKLRGANKKILFCFDECQSIFSSNHESIFYEYLTQSLKAEDQIVCMSAVGEISGTTANVQWFMSDRFNKVLPDIQVANVLGYNGFRLDWMLGDVFNYARR